MPTPYTRPQANSLLAFLLPILQLAPVSAVLDARFWRSVLSLYPNIFGCFFFLAMCSRMRQCTIMIKHVILF